jgi:type II secretory pathway component GspD/PulD (secretin)
MKPPFSGCLSRYPSLSVIWTRKLVGFVVIVIAGEHLLGRKSLIMTELIKKYCRTVTSALLVVVFFISAVPAATGAEAVSKTAKEKLETRITYSCVDLPIENVLMQLAEKAGVDIVKSPKVTGNVTAKLTDVPLEEALTNILAAHDCTFIATDNMIRVVPVAEVTLATEELISKVYRITYADANGVAVALRNFLSERGRVALNKGTSHIVVTDTERKIKAIDKFIEELDRETPQVLVEVRIYDITTKEGFEIGTDWHVGRNAPLVAKTTPLTETTTTVIGPKKTTSSQTTPNVTTTGQTTSSETTPDKTTTGWTTSSETKPGTTTTGRTDGSETVEGNYQDSHRNWGKMTTTGRTDSSETTSGGTTTGRTDSSELKSGGTTTGRTDSSELKSGGTTTSLTTTDGATTTETKETRLPTTTYRRKPFVGGSFNRVEGGTLNFSLLNDAVDLDLAMNILSTQVESKLLANPRILVVDNEKADFQIIREVPYTELTQTGRGQMITSTVFKPVGIKLEVTPHVTREGVIRLHILPEFSILVSQDIHGVPTIDTRKADTITLVKDGQTVAIGGLRRRQTSKDISKVPVLGDMPLVGGLFQSESESVEINELLVFITTKIIGQPELAEAETTKGAPAESLKTPIDTNKLQEGQVQPTVAAKPAVNSSSHEVMMKVAFGYLKTGRFELAKELLTSVIQLQPSNNTAYQYLGYCHLKLQDLDKAIENYGKAVELNDNDWEAHRGLGVAYMLKATRDNDQALKAAAVKQWHISLDIKPDQRTSDQLRKLIDKYTK